jgi:hypothetical protein
MKELLHKIIHGAAFGFGLGLVFFLFVFVYEENRYQIKRWLGPDYIHLEDYPEHGVEILFHKQRQDTENYTIVGTVKNNGNIHWKDISFIAALTEEENQIDSCRGSVNAEKGFLNPGEEAPFKIKCGDTPTENNNYKYSLKFSYGLGIE